ncbi:ferritin-like domain-containing protein [Kitasatospora sp. NPDC051914]|uniref:ferritin-like domain-containing protein n=1 Tax=Kitasatospora sp. NPDC051914 TaxID=3154945 RepID=UPI00343DF4EF
MPSPTRRTVLALGALTGALLVSGCTEDHRDPDRGRPDPDLPLRRRAVAATDALLASYDAVLAGPGTDRADTLHDLRADVEEHRAALAAGLPSAVPSGSAPASGSATPSGPAAVPAAASVAASVAELAAAERRTAAARLADLEAASPDLARLLAAVAASGALHARALGDSGPVTAPAPAPSTGTTASGSASASATASGPVTAQASPQTSASGAASSRPAPLPSGATGALQAALAAEHAAVYGYGVVGARTATGPQRDSARAGYTAHQARRDALQRLLEDAGSTPTAAAAGYRLPFAVTDADGGGRLAAHIEIQLTAVWVDAVAATTGALRQTAATALRETALRAAQWGADLSALPGLPGTGASDGASTTAGASASPST